MKKPNGIRAEDDRTLDLFREEMPLNDIDPDHLREFFSGPILGRVDLVDGDEIVASVITPEDADLIDWAKRVVTRIAALRAEDDGLGKKARALLKNGGASASSGAE
jgi:hypothetical protein